MGGLANANASKHRFVRFSNCPWGYVVSCVVGNIVFDSECNSCLVSRVGEKSVVQVP